jgi:ATP-dependent Lon protease
MAKASKEDKSLEIPVLMLRDTVIFPNMVVPLFVGRVQSVAAIKSAWDNPERSLLLLTQKSPSENDPELKDIYRVGTLGRLKQILELSDGTVKILIEGESRAAAVQLHKGRDYLKAQIHLLESFFANQDEVSVLHKAVFTEFESYSRFNSKISQDFIASVRQIRDSSIFSDTIACHFPVIIEEKQKLLEMCDIKERLERLLYLLESENNVYSVEKRIRGRVKKQIEKTQREYYLNEQLRAIHRELGNSEDAEEDFHTLEERIKKTRFSQDAKEHAISRLNKLRSMNAMSSEAHVVKSYLEWLLDIPWKKYAKIKKNLNEAESILNRDHFGLQKVKDRILEYLAVQSRVSALPGQILCFVGPPGVGKTSLGKSIAEATGRSFVRVSLGGVSDEAEIRGHRSTYIGSMPGKIIQGMKKAKSSNPLFLLDEVDKLGHDWRGDPMSALLEVLDPEQNAAFNDHYIEVDYDLSQVMFVATANTLSMPQPLLDRMEIIRISGYTEEEKLQIAREYLVRKQMKLHGVTDEELTIHDSSLIKLIREYTREAGVRQLEREIATLARKSVKEIITDKIPKIIIDDKYIRKFCGVPKYSFGKSELFKSPGISTGLAWTETGGDILFIEVLLLDGKGVILQTGKLGDVMKESIQASISYVRSQSSNWGISSDFFEKHDIHVHVPEGATPKDGPSAGTAICTALASALRKTKVRHDVAMTGEINLRGQVLEIGGLKEKVLAAQRSGIKTIIIPQENEKDLEEIDEKIKNDLTFVFASTLEDVLKCALEPVCIGV